MRCMRALWDKHINRPAKQFIAAVAEKFFDLDIDVSDEALGIDHEHGVRGAFNEQA